MADGTARGPASPAGGSHESGGEQSSPHSNVREQDRYLPIANISRIMKKALPSNGKIAKDAKDTVQECVSEFISFITSEASDKCQKEKRKTINGDDLLWAMSTLGFEDYIEPLKIYLARYRELEGDAKGSARGGDGSLKRDAVGALAGQNPQFAIQGSLNYISSQVKQMEQAQNCLLPMGVTSENVAYRFGVTRQEQDQAAVESHRKAAAATAAGQFKDEIITVATKIVDPKTGDEKPVTISVDDGIRPNTSLSNLAKLKPAFKKDGSTTAGNSSQVTDGAGAVLLMKRSVAMRKGLPILGVFRTFAAVGVDPAIMGIGPAVAIPAAVKAAGLELDDIDLFEINEAFASQFVYCRKKLELDPQKINVNGGAMALGHPLGATGARCVATLLHEMKRRGKDCRFGVISMCIGTGMGAAAVFERGDCTDELCNARKVETNLLLSKDAL